jgi:hypothetical protein
MENFKEKTRPTQRRRPWEPPAVKTVGTIGQLLQAGGGKLSLAADDSGDAPFKPKGHG